MDWSSPSMTPPPDAPTPLTPPPDCPNTNHYKDAKDVLCATCALCGHEACQWCLDFDSDGGVECGGVMRDENVAACVRRRGE